MTRTRKRAAPAPAPAPAAASGFGALSAGEAHTVLQLLLPKLPVYERARAGAVNRAWRDAASAPDVWARIDLDGCAKTVDVRALVALCTRAGAALTELRLTEDCPLLSTAAVLYALKAGGCVGLRTLKLSLPVTGTHRLGAPPLQFALDVEDAQALRAACPALEKLIAALLCVEDGDVATVMALHPGAWLALIVAPYYIFGVEGGTSRSADLSHPSVVSVHPWFDVGDPGLTEEEAVALAELAMPSDTKQPDSAESAEPKRPALWHLELLGESVGDASAAAVAAALRAPRCALRTLNLWGCALTDSGVEAIADALANNASLRMLHVRSFDNEPILGDLTARALAAAMRVNSSLRFLSLTGEFSNASCAALFAGLTGHAELRVLRLNNLGTEVMDNSAGSAFGAALRAPNCRLETVSLTFDGGFEPAGSAALGAGLAGNTSLRKLRMRSKMGDVPASQLLALARALHSALLVNTTLQSLDLIDLDSRAMAALAPALAVHPSLTDLDLNFSFFGDAGAVALARALAAPTCACIRLDVRYCGITARGAAALTDVLRHNTRVEVLRAHNNLSFPVDTLGKALRANAASRLKTLTLDHTRCLRVLTNALVNQPSVTSLTLQDFSLSSDNATLATMLSQPRCALRKLHLKMARPGLYRHALLTLSSGLSRNTSLTRLNIEAALFDTDNATTLGRALRGHPRLALLQFADTRWSPDAATALVRALCAADGSDAEGSFDALAALYLDFRSSGGDPLSDEVLTECHTLMDAREPYALTLLEHAIT
jgi:hypothetical protein